MIRSEHYRYRLSTPSTGLAIIFMFSLIATGCRGPEGPGGIDSPGLDVLPPTLQINEPWPLGQYWDNLVIGATAVDNVAVDRVIFTLDGSPAVGSLTMVLSVPPYKFTLPLETVSTGWHFVGAYAYDLAGNVTEAAPRSVWLGHSAMLSDTACAISYHNGITGTIFTIPDTARAEAFWIRITPAKEGVLRNVSFKLGGVFSDTAEISMEVWTGTSIPTRLDTTVRIDATAAAGEVRSVQFDLSENQSRIRGEFFIVLGLLKRNSSDTLRISADTGTPPWGRSGLRDDGGWMTIPERYGLNANIIATSIFYYPPIPGDTTGG